jgi:co-chaperonin GroES (HSP10)
LIERVATEESFQGGTIIVPDSTRERLARWQYAVVAQGSFLSPDPEAKGRPGTPTRLEAGDWILTPPRKAIEVEDDLLVVQERDVWAVAR